MSTSEPLGVKIISQTKQKEHDGRGGFQWTWHITYETNDGIQSHLEIPAAEYTVENVAAAIRQELGHINAVQSLS